MNKLERRCTMLSGLALCEAFQMDPKTTVKGGERKRKRFDYVLPYIGKACKEGYMAVFDVSHRYLVQARKQVAQGDLSATAREHEQQARRSV